MAAHTEGKEEELKRNEKMREDGGRRGRRGRRYGRAGRGSSKERSQVQITTERSSKVVRKDKEMRRIIR